MLTTAEALAKRPATSARDTPIGALAGVGPKRAKALAEMGLATLGDLVEYLPRDWRFESSERAAADLVHDQIQTVRGEVIAAAYVPGRPRNRFEATLKDAEGNKLALVWFNGAWLRFRLRPGMLIRVRGKVRMWRNIPQMANPKWEEVDQETPAIDEDSFRAVYAATARIPSETIEAIIRENLEPALTEIRDPIPAALLKQRRLVSRQDAYRRMHRPRDERDAREARKRLVYDELLMLQLGLGLSKRLREGKISAPVLRIDRNLDARIRARFPFEMTGAQENAAYEIAHDLKSGKPMNRLLQGDVGSGKTIVALYAMLVGVANKLQSAILAPTEVLAVQHYLTLSKFLEGSSVRIELFTGKLRAKERAALLIDLADGKIDIAVGTQALLSQGVDFGNLGLVVVDEQHKLGVRQRAHLRDKGMSPHYLVMTATPIPRTLALSYLADFDVTTIDELPPGRQRIETRQMPAANAAKAYEFLRRQVERGRQGYVVLPQIEADELSDARSVKKHFEELSAGPLKGLRLAMLHGQMNTNEKSETMASFRAGQIDVLVATTVIEVGIDVPNATTMVIENAERFGLSQLHQLRGRVGRGSEKSYCLLIGDPTTEEARQRLRAMCDTSDGFKLAETDLQLRGPGDFFGTRQHGLPPLKVANITEEMDLLQQARADALEILAADPHMRDAKHELLREELLAMYGQTLGLALVG